MLEYITRNYLYTSKVIPFNINALYIDTRCFNRIHFIYEKFQLLRLSLVYQYNLRQAEDALVRDPRLFEDVM